MAWLKPPTRQEHLLEQCNVALLRAQLLTVGAAEQLGHVNDLAAFDRLNQIIQEAVRPSWVMYAQNRAAYEVCVSPERKRKK